MLDNSHYWYSQTEAANLKEEIATLAPIECVVLAAACVTHATNQIIRDSQRRAFDPGKLVQLSPWSILQSEFWKRYTNRIDRDSVDWIASRTVDVFESVYVIPDEPLPWQVAEMISWATLTSLTIGDPRNGDPSNAVYDSLYRAYKAIFLHFSATPDAYGKPQMGEVEKQCAECVNEVEWQITCLKHVRSGEFKVADLAQNND